MAEYDDKEQRTEDATPRRREEAREKGQVALSSELVAGIGLAAGIGMLATNGPHLMQVVAGELRDGIALLSSVGTSQLDVPTSSVLVSRPIKTVMAPLGAVVVPTILVCALAGYFQVGFRVSPKAIEVDPEKIDPLRGMQRLASMRSLVRTSLSILKIVLIMASTSIVAWAHVDEVAHIGTNELGPLLAALGVVALRATAAAIGVVLALAVIDTLYQRFQLERDLRMTHAEVKEEHRLTEGDPHVRSRIRAVQREMAMRRMMSDVPKATVVVTNPTHYAVALRYEREASQGHSAPVVLAKGVDHLAQRIKEVARASGVACHEDVPLARALYARVRVGQEIPEELYSAVAAVIATVYRMQEAHA